MAREARAIGINWSFTPVIDINRAFRSAIVGTRSFGSDVDLIERHALAAIRAFQREGVAATVKHWPGEGYDDRDQHLRDDGQSARAGGMGGELRAALPRRDRAGRDVGDVGAHRASRPSCAASTPDAGVEAFRPASVSRLLNVELLRERLGFNGLIVSDATPMGGFGAWAGRDADASPR